MMFPEEFVASAFNYPIVDLMKAAAIKITANSRKVLA
jgi:hypothetical protein